MQQQPQPAKAALIASFAAPATQRVGPHILGSGCISSCCSWSAAIAATSGRRLAL